MTLNIVKITNDNKEDLKEFIENMGESNKTFRYFEKRNLDCIKNHLISYLIMENDIPVAYGHLDKEKNDVWLGICVNYNKKGLGLGKKMMAELMQFAITNNIDRVRLSVDKQNKEAIRLYKKFGFLEDEERKEILMMSISL